MLACRILGFGRKHRVQIRSMYLGMMYRIELGRYLETHFISYSMDCGVLEVLTCVMGNGLL